MNSVSSNLVIVFSKAAEADLVKTRMRKVLTAEQCLSLHISLLKDTLYKIRDFPAVLYLTGSGNLTFQPDLPVRYQTGEDLGARLLNAFQEQSRDHTKVVIIGTDSPTFPPEQITKAFAALETNDIVIGPCDDGGYYLIGMCKPIPEVFLEIPWGTQDVLKKTIERISTRPFLLLDPYFDVDLPEDLTRLKDELEKNHGLDASNVKKWLADYFGNSAR